GVDANNNGIDDVYEGAGYISVPTNTDTTDAPDYLDNDSDNDGLTDIVENNEGVAIATGVDTDGDGLDDAWDDVVGNDVNDNINTPNAASLGDEDGDGEVDYRDILDSDNDGVADNVDPDDDNDGVL
ncbi:gliding motility-associated C-terminal domain-containing protein, partial [Flavobacterium sp. KDG-16]|nr:gliding motility-associated C-terminal domain-containing protein [Flavobacterium difficile]